MQQLPHVNHSTFFISENTTRDYFENLSKADYMFDKTGVRIVFIFLYTLVFVFCFFGNLLVILVVTLNRRLRNVTNFFLLNLAVADLCVGIFCVYQNLTIYLITRFKAPCKERKIALMGYRSVGKSSLSIQFIEGQFVDSYDPTIENTFTKLVRINSQHYDVKLVDTAGQDEYSIFPSQYSMDVHGYVLVYSITSTKSFEVIKVIYEKLLDLTGKSNLPIVLVGNKTDLHMERTVSPEDGRSLAELWNVRFFETSAKQNESVSTVFHTVIMEIEKADKNTPQKQNCRISYWIFGDFLCKMYQFITSFSYTTSIFVLVLISVERYYAILHPITSKQLLTTNRLRTMVVIAWFISALYSAPKFFWVITVVNVIGDEREIICIPHRKKYNSKLFDIINFFLLYLIPLVIMMIKINNESFRKSQIMSSHILKSRQRVIRMLIIIVITFATCNLPLHARKLWQYWSSSYDGSSAFSTIFTPLTFLIAYLNSALNPVLYAFFSYNFRLGMKEFLVQYIFRKSDSNNPSTRTNDTTLRVSRPLQKSDVFSDNSSMCAL